MPKNQYPHEIFLSNNDIEISDLSSELQAQIAEFEAKFGKYAPSEKVKSVLDLSNEIKHDIADELRNFDLDEDFTPEEANEAAIKTLLAGRENGKCSLSELQMNGFTDKLTVAKKWKSYGSYSALRESVTTKTIYLKKNA